MTAGLYVLKKLQLRVSHPKLRGTRQLLVNSSSVLPLWLLLQTLCKALRHKLNSESKSSEGCLSGLPTRQNSFYNLVSRSSYFSIVFIHLSPLYHSKISCERLRLDICLSDTNEIDKFAVILSLNRCCIRCSHVKNCIHFLGEPTFTVRMAAKTETGGFVRLCCI